MISPMHTLRIGGIAAIVCFTSIAEAQELQLAKLPKYQTPVPYANLRNAKVTQNLGPTGARGWIYGHVEDTLESREILIRSVEPGSPADGILQPSDVITGAAAPPDVPFHQWKTEPQPKPFDSDARLSFARAITWAESDAGKGKLRLLRCRDGRTEEVVVQLPVMGTYAADGPARCPKSAKIVENAAKFLAEQMPVTGYAPGVGEPHHAGFLLASGNDAYLDHVRRSACAMSINHTISDAGHETWRWGNTNVFLCEYYLATGDERVLPTIQGYCKVLADGQCNPGTWGHRAVPDFIPPGYGSLNSSGVVCFFSLALAKQCGIDYSDTALRRSVGFYGSYAGRGSIPYGDHPPSYASTSNGKNGAVALAFGLLGAQPASQWFARLCASSNLPNLEGGHSGNYFNQTWSPLAAALTGSENYAAFLSRLHPYRDLARRSDGSFIAQPLPNLREGDLGTGNYVSKGPMWSTGSYALTYLAGTKRLAMLGRTDSVFAANPPQELQPALALYRQKNFGESRDAAGKLSSAKDERVRRLAAQLADISQRNLNSIQLTLDDMAKALEIGDIYQLKCQLQGIGSLLDPGDERLKAMHAATQPENAAPILEQGRNFHAALRGFSWSGPQGYEAIVPSVRLVGRNSSTLDELTRKGAEPYRTAAARYLESNPPLKMVPELTLLPSSGQKGNPTAPAWRIHPVKSPAANWIEPGFGDASWTETALPIKAFDGKGSQCLRARFHVEDPAALAGLVLEYDKAASMRVYLNGTMIVDLVPRGGAIASGKRPILLKPSTLELLKKGENTLAVLVSPAIAGFDCQLKAIGK